MKKYEFTGKNIQAAIDNGLKQLNLKQEDVDIKIISEGGLFSKAKVELITNETEEIKEPLTEVKEIKKEVKKAIKAESKENKKDEKTEEKKEKKEVET